MKLDTFIEGLLILKQYFNEPGYDLGAEHDIFYVYKTDRPLEPTVVQRLHDLGWHQEEAVVDGKWTPANYDPEESWSAYV